MWHVETLAKTTNDDRMAILGSSSVVNGVDGTEVDKILQANSVDMAVQNLGLTGLTAGELPNLAEYVFTPSTRQVVFLYNGFSFGNEFNPSAAEIRWDTSEMLRIAPPSLHDFDLLSIYASAFIREHMSVLRYREFLEEMLFRALTGTLRPLSNPFDVDPNLPAPSQPRPRTFIEPLPRTDQLRAAFLNSTEMENTLGYRGLRRFCEKARDAHIPLIVSPVPEPDFALFWKYAQGTSRDVVDRKVKTIADECGARFVPRDYVRELELTDQLFLDHVHMAREGRLLFSRKLAGKLIELRQTR